MQRLKRIYKAEIKLLFRVRQLGVVIPADFADSAGFAGINILFGLGLIRFIYALITPLLRSSYGLVMWRVYY
ncbi:hypothetical protein [Leeuwenhoekiella marinoflava]|uniref:Uncharacterized protein n=2 Tax=Leeuwenhoekiella marinoflava TaxID=988 RepID=A0A4Q0PIJ0_9FLAO|nr:hypothetical protein [Leeuwenhoekiella marinoflava]RXG26914.1 hypothetical protein DSL99_3224 [Leeuwenhoekiella marinoflava]SHF41020.1 hypothetical protein SAMN02745246_02427 [Leeuwenhoekiella marinoflava DSM 3653]